MEKNAKIDVRVPFEVILIYDLKYSNFYFSLLYDNMYHSIVAKDLQVINPLSGTDVDECVEGLHSCHAVREFCINEIGKYRCEAIIVDDVNAGGSQYERVPHATLQPPVQECPNGFGYDLKSRQCLGKYS